MNNSFNYREQLDTLRNKEISGKEFNGICGSYNDFITFTDHHNNEEQMLDITKNSPIELRTRNLPQNYEHHIGFEFCGVFDLHNWLKDSDDYVCKVSIPDDARVFIGENLMRTNKIIMSPTLDKKHFIRDQIQKQPKIIETLPLRYLTGEKALEIVRCVPEVIQHYPRECLTDEIALAGVRARPDIFKYLPLGFLTEELLLAVLVQRGELIKDIPEDLLTTRLALAAVIQNGTSLEHIPNELWTEKIVLAAIKSRPIAIKYVRTNYLTDKLVCAAITAMEKDPYPECMLKYLPKEHLTEDTLQHYVKHCASPNNQVISMLGTIDREYLTYNVALACAAIKYEIPKEFLAVALKTFPAKFLTERFFREFAEKNSPAGLKDIPQRLLTKNIVRYFVTQNGMSLYHVPLELMTEDIVFDAVSQDPRAIIYVPHSLMTEDVLLTCVSQDGMCLEYVPAKLITEKIALTAVEDAGTALRYVPPELRNKEIVELAIRKNGRCLSAVPQEFLTLNNVIIAAYTMSPTSFRPPIPQQYYEYETVGVAVVTRNGENIKYIPPQYLTEKIVSVALSNYPLAITYVPEKFLPVNDIRSLITRDARVIGKIPSKYLTEELILEAIDTMDYHTIRYIFDALPEGEGFMTERILSRAVDRFPDMIYKAPSSYVTVKRILSAIKKGATITSCPEKYLTKELLLAAIKHDANNVQYIPQKLFKKKYALEAVRKNGLLIEHVPNQYLSEEVIMTAINEKARSITKIPEQYLTERNILAAINRTNSPIRPNSLIKSKRGEILKQISEVHLTEKIKRDATNYDLIIS